MNSQFHFVDGTAVHIGSQVPDVPKDVYIRKRLAGIEKNGIGVFKSILQFGVLLLYFLCVVNP